MTSPYAIEALDDQHDRKVFQSGSEPLDRYFATQATQDIRRRISGCFVAVLTGTKTVVGYYTLAASSVPLPDITPALAKKLPRYPLVPAARIGRLAIAGDHQGRGLGAALIIDAITRTLKSEVIAFALVVDAKDASAEAFYKHLGFTAFTSLPSTLYLPLTNARNRFSLP